jgi:hypothetical protein
MFRVRYGKEVARIGRLGLALVIFGMALVAFGQFGFACFGFARSGNYWIGPGVLCVELGLLGFAVSAVANVHGRCRYAGGATRRGAFEVNETLDYASPPKPRKQPYWWILFAAWIASVPIVSALDQGAMSYLYGGPADGGATMLAMFAIAQAVFLVSDRRRRDVSVVAVNRVGPNGHPHIQNRRELFPAVLDIPSNPC